MHLLVQTSPLSVHRLIYASFSQIECELVHFLALDCELPLIVRLSPLLHWSSLVLHVHSCELVLMVQLHYCELAVSFAYYVPVAQVHYYELVALPYLQII